MAYIRDKRGTLFHTETFPSRFKSQKGQWISEPQKCFQIGMKDRFVPENGEIGFCFSCAGFLLYEAF